MLKSTVKKKFSSLCRRPLSQLALSNLVPNGMSMGFYCVPYIHMVPLMVISNMTTIFIGSASQHASAKLPKTNYLGSLAGADPLKMVVIFEMTIRGIQGDHMNIGNTMKPHGHSVWYYIWWGQLCFEPTPFEKIMFKKRFWGKHSSEIRGICLMKWPDETLQNLPYFI